MITRKLSFTKYVDAYKDIIHNYISTKFLRFISECQYPVHIFTGDKWGAGTDANVIITIFGEEGDSGEKKLDNSNNNFERAQ